MAEDFPRYFDREGQPIDLHEWGRLSEDRKYKVLKQESVGVFWISTVWLGLDHSFRRRLDPTGEHEPPVIFETMVFDQGPKGAEETYQGLRKVMDGDDYSPWSELDAERYATEAEALAGHARMVEKWSQPQ